MTSVDFQDIIKRGGKKLKFYEGVSYRENFKISPFEKIKEELFAFRQKQKDERNDYLQNLDKLTMSRLIGIQFKKDTNES